MAVFPGRFSHLKMSTANGSTTLSVVAQVVSFTPPQLTNPPVDITVLGSTWREFLGTIPDGGTVGLSIIWDQGNADHARLATLLAASTPEEYKLIASTTTKVTTFQALVADFQPQEVVVDNVWRANVNLKVSGAVTITT